MRRQQKGGEKNKDNTGESQHWRKVRLGNYRDEGGGGREGESRRFTLLPNLIGGVDSGRQSGGRQFSQSASAGPDGCCPVQLIEPEQTGDTSSSRR